MASRHHGYVQEQCKEARARNKTLSILGFSVVDKGCTSKINLHGDDHVVEISVSTKTCGNPFVIVKTKQNTKGNPSAYT